MSRKIIGVTVGTTLPKPNFNQTDPTKGDYIKNKPDFDGLSNHVDDIGKKVGDTSVAEQISSALVGLATEKYADNAASAVKSELLNGAGEAYDTLKELADLINENENAIDVLNTVAAGKADTATTIAGYGITDAYTSQEVDEKIDDHNNDNGAHTNMGWLTSEDEVADSPTPFDADTLNGYNAAHFDDQIAVERARINSLMALEEGSTTGDAELQDIRVGFDGTVYETAGDAVRAQGVKITVEALDDDGVPINNQSRITVTNQIANGNFKSSDNWSIGYVGDLRIENDVATVTLPNMTATSGLLQPFSADKLTLNAGDIWYIGVHLESEFYEEATSTTKGPFARLWIRSSSGDCIAIENKVIMSDDCDVYGCCTVPEACNGEVPRALFQISYSYVKGITATPTCTFDNAVMINLTDAYGSGNEPMADEFHELLVANGGYVDGTATLVEGGSDDSDVDINSELGYKLSITSAKGTETISLYQGHTPVKGVDYWTDDDREYLVREVTETVDTLSKPLQEVRNSIGENVIIEDITETLTITTGSIDKNRGEINPVRTNGRCTHPFEVKAGEVYHLWGVYTTWFCLVALYDEQKNFITAPIVATEDIVYAQNLVYSVPTTAMDANGNEKVVAYMACSSADIGGSGIPVTVKKEATILNNVQKKIVYASEDSVVQKLDKVLCSPDGSEWVLTISNDGTILPIKLRASGSDVNTSIVLPKSLGVGIYTLKYEDAAGTLQDYLDICSIEVAATSATVSYNGFIAENCAPENVTAIGIYNASNERVGGIGLGFLKNKYSGKQYSFAAISDVHIGQADSVEDFTNAVAYFDANNDIEFTTICGDAVDNSSVKSQLETYQSIANTAVKPIYVAIGNHESLQYADGESYENIKGYFAQDKYPNINQELYYSFTRGNDVFIMFGLYGNPNYNETFSKAELQWLYETLEANRNKRCFLFMHYFPKDGSGDAVECYSSDGLGNTVGKVFLNLMKHYKNVIYFHGHSHAMFKVQELNAMNTIDRIYGRYSIHIPSLTWPTYPNDAMSAYVKNSSAGEGYVVDVYEHGIALRGRDFESGLFSPIGSFYLDTVLEKVAANTFYDETGTILTPILA